MKKSDSVLSKVFLYGLPLVVLLAAFCHFLDTGSASHHGMLGRINALCGLTLSVWMALTVYLGLRLIVSAPFREQVLTRLAFMRERDEREAMITGKAARATFLTSLAVLVFLFCLSCFQVSIYRVPPEKAIDGKTRVLSLGVGLNLVEDPAPGKNGEASGTRLFAYTGLPLSTTAVILILIALQVVCYNCSVRRLAK